MPCHFTHYLLQVFPDKKHVKKMNMNSDINLSTLTFLHMPLLGHQMPLLGGTSDLGTSECTCKGDLTSYCKCQPDLM